MKPIKFYYLSIVLCFMAFRGITQTIIPIKKVNGVYVIPCEVNKLKLDFIFDTGASDCTISNIEATFMLKNGYLSRNDILGNKKYLNANGELIEGTTFNIKELIIGDISLKNISASVIYNQSAPLLLGQSALSQLGEYKIDNESSELIIGRINLNSQTEYEESFAKGRIAQNLNDFERALLEYKKALNIASTEYDKCSCVGNIALIKINMENYVDAIYDLETIKNSKTCWRDQKLKSDFNAGRAFEIRKSYNYAIEYYLKVYNSVFDGDNDTKSTACLNLGNIYANEKEFTKSAEYYKKHLNFNPNSENGLNNLAFIYYELKDWVKSIEINKRLLELNKNNDDALVSMCYCYDNLGKREMAKQFCIKSANLGNSHAKAWLKRNNFLK